MNRRVFVNIDDDKIFLGITGELIDPRLPIAQNHAAATLWMVALWAIDEIVYGQDDRTSVTFTIEIK